MLKLLLSMICFYLADMAFSGMKAVVLCKLQSPFCCLWRTLLFAALVMPMHSIELV